MNEVFSMGTTTGGFVLFEITSVLPFADGEYAWWADPEVQLTLANRGVAVFIKVAIDDFFLFRLTTEELSEEEQKLVLQTEDSYWLDGRNGKVVFGALESLPVFSSNPEEFIAEFGAYFAINPGRYRIIVYRLIGYHEDDDTFETDKEGERIPAYIVQLKPLPQDEIPTELTEIPVLSPLDDE